MRLDVKKQKFYYILGVMCGETLLTTFEYDNFDELLNKMKSILKKYWHDMYLCTFVVQAFSDNSYDYKNAFFMQEEFDVCSLKIETLEERLIEAINRNHKEN